VVRHAVAVALLPFTVAVLVPIWLARRAAIVLGPNPMISGVLLVLAGERFVLRSRPHLLWACTFFAINAVYIPLLEEPGLERRFGDRYREYRRHVPRLLPRLTPWAPGRAGSAGPKG
jgi:hypothetical protein